MRKYALRELKRMISTGAAGNLTNASPAAIPAQYEKIGYSAGTYGINGGLIRDTESGELYAITARNSILFRIF